MDRAAGGRVGDHTQRETARVVGNDGVGGGVRGQDGATGRAQTAEEAARAEILEETGYKNLRLVADLPRYHTKFYHPPKGVNRFAHFQCFLFELENDDRNPVNEEEAGKHEAIWLTEEDLASFRLTEAQQVLLTHAKGIAWGGE